MWLRNNWKRQRQIIRPPSPTCYHSFLSLLSGSCQWTRCCHGFIQSAYFCIRLTCTGTVRFGKTMDFVWTENAELRQSTRRDFYCRSSSLNNFVDTMSVRNSGEMASSCIEQDWNATRGNGKKVVLDQEWAEHIQRHHTRAKIATPSTPPWLRVVPWCRCTLSSWNIQASGITTPVILHQEKHQQVQKAEAGPSEEKVKRNGQCIVNSCNACFGIAQ